MAQFTHHERVWMLENAGKGYKAFGRMQYLRFKIALWRNKEVEAWQHLYEKLNKNGAN